MVSSLLFCAMLRATRNNEDGFALYGSAHFGSANQPWHGKETCNKTLTQEVPRREKNATRGENGYLISRGFRAQNSGVSEGFRGFPSFQRSCGRCKNSIKTYENGKSAPGFPVAEQTPIILLESRWRQEWLGVLVWLEVFLEFYVRLVSEISASTFSQTLRLSDFALTYRVL